MDQLLQELTKLPDQVLHCIARTLQDEVAGDSVKCLYCKYAPECSVEVKESNRLLATGILLELQAITSVDIYLNPETKERNILKGSWVEKYPDLMKMLTKKSFEEQQDILNSSYILKYLDSQCCK